MSEQQQPKALRLADELTHCAHAGVGGPDLQAAAELRRLHDVTQRAGNSIEELLTQIAMLEAVNQELLGALKLAQQIIGHPDDDHSKIVAEVIAKAEGKSK